MDDFTWVPRIPNLYDGGLLPLYMQQYKFSMRKPLVGLNVWRYMYLHAGIRSILSLPCLVGLLLEEEEEVEASLDLKASYLRIMRKYPRSLTFWFLKHFTLVKVFKLTLCLQRSRGPNSTAHNLSLCSLPAWLLAKACSKNMGFTSSMLSSLEPSWRRTWHGLKMKVFKPQPPTLPLVSRDETRMHDL
jgi:hypothetical protein